MAVECASCGAVSPAAALFCHECGGRLSAKPTPMEPPSGYSHQRGSVGLLCPRCSTANEPESRYCYNCGLPLEDELITGHDPATYAQPAHGNPYRSLRARSNWTVGLLFAVCAASGLSMLAAFNVLDMVWQAEAGQFISLIDFDEAVSNLDAMSRIASLVRLPTVIVFLMWMHRASKNIESLGAHGQRFSPAWAVGWWFVPIMFFFRPYQVMAEIWRGSRSDAVLWGQDDWQSRPVSPLLAWWWLLWIVALFTAPALEIDSVTLQDSSRALMFSVLANVLWTSAGVLAIIVVHRIRRGQETIHRRLTAG